MFHTVRKTDDSLFAIWSQVIDKYDRLHIPLCNGRRKERESQRERERRRQREERDGERGREERGRGEKEGRERRERGGERWIERKGVRKEGERRGEKR